MAPEAGAEVLGKAELEALRIAEGLELDDVKVAGAAQGAVPAEGGARGAGAGVFVEEGEVILGEGGLVEQGGLARGDAGEEASVAGEIASETEADAEPLREGVKEAPSAA